MTKYNKREIMRNAWNIRKNANVNMSVALKAAWAQAKLVAVAEKEAAACDWKARLSLTIGPRAATTVPILACASTPMPGTAKKRLDLGISTI